jgi:hypothetical protein
MANKPAGAWSLLTAIVESVECSALRDERPSRSIRRFDHQPREYGDHRC